MIDRLATIIDGFGRILRAMCTFQKIRTTVAMMSIAMLLLIFVVGMGGVSTWGTSLGTGDWGFFNSHVEAPSVTSACVLSNEYEQACVVALTVLQRSGISHQVNSSVRLDDAALGPSKRQLLKEVSCTPFRNLPPGPDGLGLFNIALSPMQILMSKVWTTRDTFPVLASSVGSRPGSVVPNYQIIPPTGGAAGYGLSYKDVLFPPPNSTSLLLETPSTTVEIFGAIGRWCNYRSSFGLRGAMMLSVNYMGYVSVVATPFTNNNNNNNNNPPTTTPTTSTGNTTRWRHDVRWHPMGMVPFPTNATMHELSTFQRHNFPPVTGKKALGRGGLEDCLYIMTSRQDGSKRHFVVANIGFNFGAGQMFVGEITSRIVKTKYNRMLTTPPADDITTSSSPSSHSSDTNEVGDGLDFTNTKFDYEVVPLMEDPEGFGLKVGNKPFNANRTFEKNWNVIPCDWDAVAAQHQHQRRHQSTSSLFLPSSKSSPVFQKQRDHILCFLTNVAPRVVVYAFDLNSRKVIAKWRHKNPELTSKIYRGGKGVVEIDRIVNHPKQNDRRRLNVNREDPNYNSNNKDGGLGTTNESGGGGLLTLVHEKLRGGYRLEWMMLNSSAPHNLIRPYLQHQKGSIKPTEQEEASPNRPSGNRTKDAVMGRERSREGHFKLSHVPVEYVRSITASQDKTRIYFGHSTQDARGQFCTIPLPTAASASVHGLS